jgi:3D (Asp-Asp-Asp) domain-containing protein
VGSPVAEPAAANAAATTTRRTGACRFRALITESQPSLAAGAPEGPVRHKFGTLAGLPDACNPPKGSKLPQLRSQPTRTWTFRDRTKSSKSCGFLCYGPATLSRRRGRSAAKLAHGSARIAGVSAALVLLAVSAATAAGPGGRAASLRSQAGTLGARAHHALLDLYALDTRYRSAQDALASLQSQESRLQEQQRQLAQQVAATQQTLAASEERLAAHLRMLYEEGDVNTLAIVLGAQSLDDAVTQLDDLSSVADQSRQVVEVTSAAQTRLAHARWTLAARRAQLAVAVAAARRTAGDLAAARSSRLAFIARLRNQQQLKARQIASLQLAAQHVEAKSAALQAAADTGASTPSTVSLTDPGSATTDPSPAPAPAPPAASPSGRTLTVSSTGYSLPGRTATGIPVGWGVVAVDPSVIRLGTRLTIPGYGEGVAADTGGTVRGATIDLWFPTLGQALAWGRRTITITIH